MVYNCGGRFVWGSICQLTCANGNPIQGSSSIRCEKDVAGSLRWKVLGDRPPFCEVATCGKLKSPRNSITSCVASSVWEICVVTCPEKMSYPASVPSIYRCQISSGLWQPYDYVPECKAASDYESVQIEAVFMYSVGSCSSSTDVSGRFLNRLLASDLARDCGHSGCNFTNVRVDCEPVNENRRSAEYKIALNAEKILIIAVTIDLVRLPNKSHDAGLLDFYQSMANSIDDSLYHEEEKGTFRIPEIGQFEGFHSSSVKYLCRPGTKFLYTTMLCAGCGPGHMYDNTTNSCRVCPKDTYQDQDISFSCTPCPNNTVTQAEMATSEALCLDLCRPGQFSNNGVQPCDPCPVGSYQSKYGMKSCDLCPYGMSTVNNETTVIDDCIFFNTRLSETTSQAAIQIFDKIPTTFTFMTWLTSASTLMTSSLTFSLGSDQDNSTAAFLALDKIVLAIREQRDIGGLKVIRKWHHIALTYKKGAVRFFLNGELVSERSRVRLSRLSQKSLVFQKSAEVNAVVVSGPQLTTSFYTELQLREFATSCHKKVKTNLLARKPWEFLALSPSTCNDLNLCDGEPCGQHGTCISGLDTLQCLCHTPWSGDRCQVAPDFCADNLCANGATCVNLPKKNTYKCFCAPNFMGKLCTNLRRQKNRVRQNAGMALN
ncbi:sushi, von Willebrand factor type A, EGF and pentraxin domain-containing protein 1-like [Physella acuta]|uniref:sushi, von Willebrand factor type A, EGF and pentraxin domain-containing protein 1-like n=1 Tax=Physella acuta TaxID=109671 RepID=UPI0027DB111A|nr:sushi, von Willebrand factor type A, EGF and pentraxin domain-containing protein 1-like [Physella acuta]